MSTPSRLSTGGETSREQLNPSATGTLWARTNHLLHGTCSCTDYREQQNERAPNFYTPGEVRGIPGHMFKYICSSFLTSLAIISSVASQLLYPEYYWMCPSLQWERCCKEGVLRCGFGTATRPHLPFPSTQAPLHLPSKRDMLSPNKSQ